MCPNCPSEVRQSELVRGMDGIYAVKPEPVTAWSGRFLAVYPDDSQSDFDLDGTLLKVGGVLPGGWILDRWDVTDRPVKDGRWGVVGILRAAESQ